MFRSITAFIQQQNLNKIYIHIYIYGNLLGVKYTLLIIYSRFYKQKKHQQKCTVDNYSVNSLKFILTRANFKMK